VDETDALAALPRAYRLALRLRDLGADEELISDCLEVDPAALPTLHAVAEQKLAALQARSGPPARGPTGPRPSSSSG
jgi:hypothetical protein